MAVFDHKEAACYLKGNEAMQTHHFIPKAGFTTYEMFFREGPVAGTPFSQYFTSSFSSFAIAVVVSLLSLLSQ